MSAGAPAKADRLWCLALLVCVIAAAAVIRVQHPQFWTHFYNDEADYASALQYGIRSNYLGLHERTGASFAASVLAEYRAHGRARPFRDDWRDRDSAGLRHYHPPLGLLPAAALASRGVRSEQALRSVPLVIGLLTILAAAGLGLALLPAATGDSRLVAAALAGGLVAASPYHAQASAELSFHAAFGLLATLALAALTVAWRDGDRRAWMLACGLLGLAVLTIPYWLLLVPAAGLVWWRGAWPPAITRGRLLVQGAALALAACLIAWPPALLTLNLVKPAMLYGWIVVNPLAERAPASSWVVGFAQSHALITAGLLAAAGLGIAEWRRGRRVLVLAPAAVFIAGFVLLNVRVYHMKPLYSSAIVPASAALAGAALALLLRRWLRPRVVWPAAACLVAAVLAAPTGAALTRRADDSWRVAIRELRDQLAGATVLVYPRPAAATMRYYLTESAIVPAPAEAADEREIRALVEAGRIDAVLLPAREDTLPEPLPEGSFEPGGTVVFGRAGTRMWMAAQDDRPGEAGAPPYDTAARGKP